MVETGLTVRSRAGCACSCAALEAPASAARAVSCPSGRRAVPLSTRAKSVAAGCSPCRSAASAFALHGAV